MNIRISVNVGRAVCVESPHPLTSGMVGLKAVFEFGDEWNGLIKNAVCYGSGQTKVVLNVGNEVFSVPHECTASAGGRLEIGVEGRKGDGTLVIPTVKAFIGKIYEGVNDNASESVTPTPTQVEQLQAQLNELEEDKAEASELNELSDSVSEIENDVNEMLEDMEAKATTAALNAEALARSQADTALDGRVTALENGGGGSGSPSWNSITGKPSTFPPSSHEHTVAQISDFPSIPHDTLELTNGAGYIKADEVPIATAKTVGTVKLRDGNTVYSANASGLSLDTDGNIGIFKIAANNYRINSRFFALTNKNFADILKAELTDGYGTTYTETEQAAARARLGISIWDGSVSE